MDLPQPLDHPAILPRDPQAILDLPGEVGEPRPGVGILDLAEEVVGPASGHLRRLPPGRVRIGVVVGLVPQDFGLAEHERDAAE